MEVLKVGAFHTGRAVLYSGLISVSFDFPPPVLGGGLSEGNTCLPGE